MVIKKKTKKHINFDTTKSYFSHNHVSINNIILVNDGDINFDIEYHFNQFVNLIVIIAQLE